jgi:hypothetical protein
VSDGKDNVIDLNILQANKQKAVKELLTQAYEYVHANPAVTEAVLVLSSKDSVATYKTALQDPFVFISLMELLKYRTLRDEF